MHLNKNFNSSTVLNEFEIEYVLCRMSRANVGLQTFMIFHI